VGHSFLEEKKGGLGWGFFLWGSRGEKVGGGGGGGKFFKNRRGGGGGGGGGCYDQ